MSQSRRTTAMGVRFGLPTLLTVLLPVLVAASAHSQQVVAIRSGDTLSLLAERTYGSMNEWPAIVSATNARTALDSRLQYIGDPNRVVPGQYVYLPASDSAQALSELIRDYNRAVVNMSLAEPWETVDSLVAIGEGPVDVVTWSRKALPLGKQKASGDVWVTVEGHLRDFCSQLGADIDLDLRIAQRLGMPPQPNKTVFVRIRLQDPQRQMFRPCANSSLATTTCSPGPPAADDPRAGWFYRQYFSAYGTARPDRYPWTSLGYTYDWGGTTSVVGESEFVIPEGTDIEVIGAVPTAEYCGR